MGPAFLQIRNDCSHFASQQRQGRQCHAQRSSPGKGRSCSWRLSLLTPDRVLGTGHDSPGWLHDSQAPRSGPAQDKAYVVTVSDHQNLASHSSGLQFGAVPVPLLTPGLHCLCGFLPLSLFTSRRAKYSEVWGSGDVGVD